MHGGANDPTNEPGRKPGRDRHGDRAPKDAWFARRQAETCLRFEVDRPGRAMFIEVGPGPEPYWLPRGEAVPAYKSKKKSSGSGSKSSCL
ncbi:hypothetical protein GWI34_07240 [Actinomadura sp. DSM 109109]|nr:hypothetical protein [Actinomadura lepetitiana]